MSEYFVEGLWPKHRLNLICGASGAGKTRWILPRLIELHRAGHYVLYTCCDRTIEDAQDTLVSMGYAANALPMESFQDEEEDLHFNFEGLQWLIKGHRAARRIDPSILYVESLTILAKEMNKATEVVEFSRRVNKLMAAENLSIWGSSWCTKVKENEKFVRTRDNVMGSAAWPGICGTIVYIDSPAGETEPERTATIMPRNGKSWVERYLFNDRGILERYLGPDDLLAKGGSLTYDDFRAIGMNDKAISRYVTQAMEDGKLDWVGKGKYRVL